MFPISANKGVIVDYNVFPVSRADVALSLLLMTLDEPKQNLYLYFHNIINPKIMSFWCDGGSVEDIYKGQCSSGSSALLFISTELQSFASLCHLPTHRKPTLQISMIILWHCGETVSSGPRWPKVAQDGPSCAHEDPVYCFTQVVE